mgnify:CR=1 FL=1|jgi:hypothetical protein
MKLQWRATGWNAAGLTALISCLALLWLSGLLLELTEHDEAPDWLQEKGAWTHALGVLHGLSAWAITLVGGRYVWAHATLCLNRPSTFIHRCSGWVSLATLLTLAFSGLLLMYGQADWHNDISALHFGLGLFLPMALLVHVCKRFARRSGTATRP